MLSSEAEKALHRDFPKHKLAFVCYTRLTTAAGTEQFVLNMIKNAPLEKFQISIVQTDFEDRQRLAPENVNEILKQVDVYSISSFRQYLGALDRQDNTFLKLIGQTLKQLILRLLYPVYAYRDREIFALVKKSDIVYLILNEDQLFFKNKSNSQILIGSTHCETLSSESRFDKLSSLQKLYLRIKHRNISGFHFTSKKLFDESHIHKRLDFTATMGTDTNLFYPRATPIHEKRVRFIFVSRLERNKGLITLLNAWNLISDVDNTGHQLNIIGKGSLEEYVRRATRNKTIIYHGALTTSQLADVYRSCDIFVFPTEVDTYGLVVLEALASGLFVITTNRLKGLFDDIEGLGMLEYVENNPRAFSDSMRKAASNITSIRGKRSFIYEYIKTKYDWKSASANFFSKLEDCLVSEDTWRANVK